MSTIAFGQGVELGGSRAVLGNLNPVAKLTITAVITVGLLITLDSTTSGVILIVELLALPFVGLRWRTVAIRGGMLVVVALIVTLVNALFSGEPSGVVFFQFGPFSLSSATLLDASVVGMRILALSLPAVLLLSTTDPAQLADSVQQHWKVPARYAMSMLVGLRLLPLLIDDWREMSAARRARGLTARGPISAVSSATSRTVGLLVVALRRAVRMALAMQARGFDPYAERTVARPSVIRPADYAAMLAATALVALAIALSVARGTFTFALTWPF